MSDNEFQKTTEDFQKGFAMARYKLIKEKALRNETLVEGDYKGGTRTVPARQLLKELYNEEITINN